MNRIGILIIIVSVSCSQKLDSTDYSFLTGEWVYRSLHNIPDANVAFCEMDSMNANCISNLEFATATMRLRVNNKTISGELDMGQWGKLDVSGLTLDHSKFKITGNGIPNTNTDGWVYDYVGFMVPTWDNGIDQNEALVGSVVRSADHGNSQKGKVASFYMVKKSN